MEVVAARPPRPSGGKGRNRLARRAIPYMGGSSRRTSARACGPANESVSSRYMLASPINRSFQVQDRPPNEVGGCQNSRASLAVSIGLVVTIRRRAGLSKGTSREALPPSVSTEAGWDIKGQSLMAGWWHCA